MRHAQRYWLELQAKQAVDAAMEYPVDCEDALQQLFALGLADVTTLTNVKNLYLQEAASALIQAEAVSRALARIKE
ncbi:hypothetical protein [Microcystis phage Mvi-JY20]|uniref:Uncharacterized protein n=1 Tax=Microcystis phage Mvi-JY20 TaxID=3128146 RepID=A0AAX4QG89_9CAUD